MFLACVAVVSSHAQSRFAGSGIIANGSPVTIAMVCPSGYSAKTVVDMASLNNAQFTVSSSTSLPLPADGQPTSAASYVNSGNYYRFTCVSSIGCGMTWNVLFYCAPVDTAAMRYSLFYTGANVEANNPCSVAKGFANMQLTRFNATFYSEACVARNNSLLSYTIGTTDSTLPGAQVPSAFAPVPVNSSSCSFSFGSCPGSVCRQFNGLSLYCEGSATPDASRTDQIFATPGTSCYCQSPVNVNGGWSPFDTCSSATCGIVGTQARTCTNPSPKGTGSICSGASSQPCSPSGCPVDGGWSDWNTCSVTCRHGYANPRLLESCTLNGGAACSGAGSQSCNTNTCTSGGGGGDDGSSTGGKSTASAIGASLSLVVVLGLLCTILQQ